MLEKYRNFLSALDRIVEHAVIVAMATLTVVLIFQVITRYFFNMSIVWTWDIARLSFIATVLLSIPLAFRYNMHVGIDIVSNMFPAHLQAAVFRFNAVLITGLCVVTTYYAGDLAVKSWDQMMPGINLSSGIFYVILAVSQMHCIFHMITILITGAVSDERISEL